MSDIWIDFTSAVLIAVIGSLIGMILRAWLQTQHQERELRRNKRSMDFYAEGVTLTYGRPARLYPLGLAVAFLSMAVVMLVGREVNNYPPLVEPKYEMATYAAMLFLISLTPWLVFIQAFGVRHVVTTQGIFKRSPWSRPLFASWDQIKDVSRSYWLDAYVLHTSEGTIIVRSTLENMSYLEDMMAKKIAPKV
jgi:hypothetical protein